MTTEWPKSLVEWTEDDTAYLSVVFTWDLPKAHMRAVWLGQEGYQVKAGGPACLLMPDYLEDVGEVNGEQVNALWRHNPEATFTSRGCIRTCKFCAVPKIEGDLIELDNWKPRPIVCDNNLLACSQKHFDKVIDGLKGVKGVDFNQGLDARLLTQHHADRFAELDLSCLRLAWDSRDYEKWFRQAAEKLLKVGIPKSKIRVYILLGFDDTPEDALYRLEAVKDMGFLPNPQRYNPLDVLVRDTYVGPNWTNRELIRYMRYWYNPHVWSVPFEEFDR